MSFIFLKKSPFGELIDSHDVKTIAELLMQKVEDIQKKKKKSSRNKVRDVGCPYAELLNTLTF